MKTMRIPFCYYATLITLLCCGEAPAQNATSQAHAQPAITFTMDFPGNTPPHYIMQIAADGSATYTAAADEGNGPYRVAFHLSSKAVAPWFDQARAMHFFAASFQSPRKVAFTGTKTLSYDGPDGHGSTTYVYTEDPAMVRLSGDLQHVALTLQVGQTLESHLRHQRMALDADLDDYQHALKGHMASHPEAISPALQQIIDSPETMDRVKRKATSLLSTARP